MDDVLICLFALFVRCFLLLLLLLLLLGGGGCLFFLGLFTYLVLLCAIVGLTLYSQCQNKTENNNNNLIDLSGETNRNSALSSYQKFLCVVASPG